MSFNIWGNVGNQAYMLPMIRIQPVDPETQGYTLAWDTVAGGLDYAPLSFTFATGDGILAGNLGLSAGKVYKVDAIQVVGPRVTGWAAATGTPTRTTFDTATVTTAQLAERVKALLDDLISHGLIGP
jgi:hypothetical protein